MKKRKLYRDKRANSTPLTVAIVLGLLIVCCGIAEYFRLMIIVSGVRDGLQQAVIAVSTTNYDEVYNGLREGYSGGYVLQNGNWCENLDYNDIYGRMDNLLGTKEQNGYHTKIQDGGYEYRYSRLSIKITNAPFTPSSTDKNFTADASIWLEVPLSIGFHTLPPLKMEVRATAEYMPKF